MGQLLEIDTIHCYIDFPEDRNNSIFNSKKVYDLLTADIAKTFDKYGLNYEMNGFGGKGGGPPLLFLEAIKLAWQNKELLGIIITVVKAIYGLPKSINKEIIKKLTRQRPTVFISLSLRSNQDTYTEKSDELLRKRMIALKYLLDEICQDLKHKYPIFNFDQCLDLFIKIKKYAIRFNIRAEKQNSFNSFRLINLMKSLSVRENFSCSYSFVRCGLIKRTDSTLEVSKDSRISKPYKIYYFVISSRVIEDYLKN